MTRVGPGGSHNRAIHKQHCDEVSLATDVAAASETTTARLARLGRERAALNDFVSPGQERRLQAVCGDSIKRCQSVATEIFRSLSPQKQREVRQAMRAEVR